MAKQFSQIPFPVHSASKSDQLPGGSDTSPAGASYLDGLKAKAAELFARRDRASNQRDKNRIQRSLVLVNAEILAAEAS